MFLALVLLANAGGAPTFGVTIIPPGDDGWRTADQETFYDFSTVPIPAGFFGLGSDPFTELIELAGQTLETQPPGVLDPIDTIIRRTEPTADLDLGPDTVAVEVVALSLVSLAPITVTFNGGLDPELWDVDVCLSSTVPQPEGTMTIIKTSSDGGTFTSLMPIRPQFTFTRQGPFEVVVLDCGDPGNPGICDDLLLGDNEETSWVLIGGPGNITREQFGITAIPPGVSIDADCNGSFLDPIDGGTIGDSPFQPGLGDSGGGSANCDPASEWCGATAPSARGQHIALVAAVDQDGNGTADSCEGACCKPDGSCSVKREDACGAPNTYQGGGTDCDPAGACCLGDGSCVVTLEECCLNANGDYRGDDTECGDTGACCFADGSCEVTSETCCTDAGGSFRGGGTSCTPTGACCFPDGTCAIRAQECCIDAGGTFQGSGSTCSPIGACCLPLPDLGCVETTENCCNNASGTYLGDGSACDQLGACCRPNGTCVETKFDCCFPNGVFLGVGTTCSPTGACCELAGGGCIDTLFPCCLAHLGFYIGNGTSCATEVCSPIGACCELDGMCSHLPQTDCEAVGGGYVGDSESCEEPGGGCCAVNPQGDFDSDGVVGLSDYEEFFPCLLGPGAPVPPHCACGDMDVDLDVDLRDGAQLQINFSGDP
ncbi:MAG: hypothetical protein ACYSUI_01680 [Planctomycetota bacterium]